MTEFEGVDIDELFPYWKDDKVSYRKMQKEAIVGALTALVEQDYEAYVIDAAVGFGKSGVIVTISRVMEELGYDSYITTPQLILQDQYFEEFSDIPQIKGRSNYRCLDDPEANCATGECQVDEKYNNEEVCNKCIYTLQRNKCQESAICGMNTSYMMTVRKEVFGQRYLFSVDEAHSVPEWGVGFVSVTIRESSVGFIPDFTAGFPAYIIWLEKTVYPKVKEEEEKLKERVKEFGKGKGKKKAVLGIMEAYKATKDLVKKIELLSKDYAAVGEDWTYQIIDDKKGKKIVFQPLTSGRFLNQILWSRGEKILLSSGTITPEIYMVEGGLTDRSFNIKYCVIEIPSEFPPEKSPIYYKPIGKMTNDRKDSTFPLIMKEINQVIRDRKNYKGIIHTFSYDFRPGIPYSTAITNSLDPDLRHLIYSQERNDRSGSLDKWMKNDEPSVFLSTNMTEGLNLKGDLCRYQIYLKIGFPNTQDKRVAKRLEMGHWLWYYLQALEDIEQSSGRATRSVDDWSDMFIFDLSFATMYTKYNKYIKPWFKKRLKFINV